MIYVMNDDFSYLWENIIYCDVKFKIWRIKNIESCVYWFFKFYKFWRNLIEKCINKLLFWGGVFILS